MGGGPAGGSRPNATAPMQIRDSLAYESLDGHARTAASATGVRGLDTFGPDPLLWIHTVPEVVSWARSKSEEWMDMMMRLTREQQDHVITRVIRYIEMNYAGSCTLQAAAVHVHVTPNYLSHLFKKETGQGFSQYVSKRRIEKAKLLLQSTRQSMAEIAEQTGFDNSSYFTTVFKQATGLSPREYRKQGLEITTSSACSYVFNCQDQIIRNLYGMHTAAFSRTTPPSGVIFA